MSVNAIRNPYAQTVGRPVTANPNGVGGGRAAQVQEKAQPASLTPLARPTAPAAAERSLPTEAPAGVDAELWSVLSSEERAFFAKAGQMGPLTYGRPGIAQAAPAPAPVAMRGGRLDIRA